MSYFKVVGGDLPKRTTLMSFLGFNVLSIPRAGCFFKSDEYDLKDKIIKCEQITEENKNKVFAKAGWATLGAIALGPFGLLAGLLMGGKTKNIVVAIKLLDGREFLAECDLATYKKLYSIYISTPRSDSGSSQEDAGEAKSLSQKDSVTLQDLRSLKDEGIITDEEYKKKARELFEKA